MSDAGQEFREHLINLIVGELTAGPAVDLPDEAAERMWLAESIASKVHVPRDTTVLAAEMDQALAANTEIVTMVADFFDKLVERGLHREEALVLAQSFQESLFEREQV